MTETELRLRRIKVDCLYGKKKHFNAADRKGSYHLRIGIPLLVINIIVGSILFYILKENAGEWSKYIPAIFAFIPSVLSGLQTFFDFNKKAEGHRRVGNRYLAALKRIDRLQGYIVDGLLTDEDIVEKMESIALEVEDINKEAEQYLTSKEDFNKAKKSIQGGDENYTTEELDL